MIGQIYPTLLQLNKANSIDTESLFFGLERYTYSQYKKASAFIKKTGLSTISNGIVSSKINDKRDDFKIEIINFPFLYGDVLRSPSYGVYISQLIRFARVCSE